MFRPLDPAKRIQELEAIEKILQNPKKLEKLEQQYEYETNQPEVEYKIIVMTQVDSFKEGRGFGELALMNSKPRAASIKALED